MPSQPIQRLSWSVTWFCPSKNEDRKILEAWGSCSSWVLMKLPT